MKITILCVGRLKEKYYKDAVAEYAKRLSVYCKLEVIEVPDERTRENMSRAEMEILLGKEGQRLLQKLPEHSYAAALCIEGEQRDSMELAQWLEGMMSRGISHLTLIIGGSCGLDKSVTRLVQEKISFSRLTFPHQLMRVILLEQLYRSFRILKGQPYHK